MRSSTTSGFFWYFCTYRTWSGTTSKSPFLNVLLKCRETEVVSCSVKKKNTKTTNLGLIYKLKSRYQNTRFYAYTLPTQNQYQNFGKPWDTCRKFIFTTKKIIESLKKIINKIIEPPLL